MDGKAIALIAFYSQGVPRIINNYCELSLVYGFADGVSIINIDIALAGIKDKTKNNHITIPPFIINHVKEIDDNEVTALL